MALDDVLRDTNNVRMKAMLTDEDSLAMEIEKMNLLSIDKLWELHTRLGLVSLQGQAVYSILCKRCPDKVNRKYS